jgi:hypothetical protein
MKRAQLRRGRALVLVLFIGSHMPLVGCTDNSKTSGTQVEVDPAAEAHRKAKGEAYKGGPRKKEAKSTGKNN